MVMNTDERHITCLIGQNHLSPKDRTEEDAWAVETEMEG